MDNVQQSTIVVPPKYQLDKETYPSNDITKKIVSLLIEQEASQGIGLSKKIGQATDLTKQDNAINALLQNLPLKRFEDALNEFWGEHDKYLETFKLKFLDMFINCKELSYATSQSDPIFKIFEVVIKGCFFTHEDLDSVDDVFVQKTRKKNIPDETFIAFGKAQYEELRKFVGDQTTPEKILLGLQQMYPHLIKKIPQLKKPDDLPPIPTPHQLQNSSRKEQNDLLRNASAEQLDEIRKMYYHPEMDQIVNLINDGNWEGLLEQYNLRPEADSIILAAFIQDKIKNIADLATALMFLAVAANGKRYTLHPIEHKRRPFERCNRGGIHYKFVEKGRKFEDCQEEDRIILNPVPYWIETNDVPKNQRYLITAHGSSLPEDLVKFLHVFVGGHLFQKQFGCYTMPSFALMQQQVSQYLDLTRKPIHSTSRLVPMLGLSKRSDMIDQIGRNESPFMLTTRQEPTFFLRGLPNISVWPFFLDKYHDWKRAVWHTNLNHSALALAKKIDEVLDQLPNYSKPLIEDGAQFPRLPKDSTDVEGDLTRWLLDAAGGAIVDGHKTNDLDTIFKEISDFTENKLIMNEWHKEKVSANFLPKPDAATYERCIKRAKELLASQMEY